MRHLWWWFIYIFPVMWTPTTVYLTLTFVIFEEILWLSMIFGGFSWENLLFYHDKLWHVIINHDISNIVARNVNVTRWEVNRQTAIDLTEWAHCQRQVAFSCYVMTMMFFNHHQLPDLRWSRGKNPYFHAQARVRNPYPPRSKLFASGP